MIHILAIILSRNISVLLVWYVVEEKKMQRKDSYFKMFFDGSAISQDEAWASAAFLSVSSTSGGALIVVFAPCFLDHLIIVTPLSTCTSLTSDLTEWVCCSKVGSKGEGGNENLSLGDEWVLLSGLIWVAISRRETTGETMVSASLEPPSFSSVYLIQHLQANFRIIVCKDKIMHHLETNRSLDQH